MSECWVRATNWARLSLEDLGGSSDQTSAGGPLLTVVGWHFPVDRRCVRPTGGFRPLANCAPLGRGRLGNFPGVWFC